jgi:hypothetical protein
LHTGIRLGRVLAAGLLGCALAGTTATKAEDGVADAFAARRAAVGGPEARFETFLDRLMRAESNGRDDAANPRSTALGPFQFIKSTFIDVARRHFREVATLEDKELLTLRTDRAYARRAAAIYCLESLAYLTAKGLEPSFGDLRLAYLVGPYAAARVLQAAPDTPVADILGAAVIKANPFMAGMSTSQLAVRSARDVDEHRHATLSVRPHTRTVVSRPEPRVSPRPAAAPQVACNRKLISCQRWVAMQANKQRVAQLKARKAANPGQSSRRDNRPGV